MRLSTGRPRWLGRLRQSITPVAVGYTFFAVIGFSAIIGSLANLLSIQQALRAGAVPQFAVAQPAAVPVASAPPLEPPVTAPLVFAPLVLGSMATPKPHQYENHIRIHAKRGTVTLPVHEGSVTDILGPLDVPLASLEVVSWDPTTTLGTVSNVKWVFAISDVDGVTIAGAGGHVFTLGPGAYIPEELTLPITITNPGSRPAHLTLVVGVDFAAGGGGHGTT